MALLRLLRPVPSSAVSLVLPRAVSTYGSVDSPLVNPAFIDVALSQLLKNKKSKKGDVNAFIEHFKTKMNKQNFISLLHGCRRRHVLEPRHIFTAACGLKFADDDSLDSSQFEQIFHAVSFMSHRVASVRVLLSVTAEALAESKEDFTVDQLADFMYSLMHMKSGVPEVRHLLSVLMKRIECCTENITNDSASKLIGGFRGLNCKYPEVKQAVVVVLGKLLTHANQNDAFNETECSRALYGMKRMSSNCPDVEKMMSYVLSKSVLCEMNHSQASQAIYSSAYVESDTTETKALLRFLTKQVNQLEGGNLLFDKSAEEVLAILEKSSLVAADMSEFTSALRSKGDSL